MPIEDIHITSYAVADMARSVDFYREKVGLEMLYGGSGASFSSFKVGEGYLNLISDARTVAQGARTWWGRLIFHVDDVDALYQRLVQAGLTPSTEPADASWGERYFHIEDPDSHELSFAKPL